MDKLYEVTYNYNNSSETFKVIGNNVITILNIANIMHSKYVVVQDKKLAEDGAYLKSIKISNIDHICC